MGFVFGVLQVALWIFYSAGWMLPAFGFVVGLFSNWLALKMIFSPVNPEKCCCCTFQGRFMRRQKQVAEIYSQIVADNVLSARNITHALVAGPLTPTLAERVREEMNRAVDDNLGHAGKACVHLLRKAEKFERFERALAEAVLQQMPPACRHLERYMDDSLDLEQKLRGAMVKMKPKDFERLLHTVFERDERKLVLIGGILGIVIGCLQWYTLYTLGS